MIVNGVTLPDIPADVLAQYGYLTLIGTIGTNSQGTMAAYTLQASNSKFAVVPPGMQMLDGESYTYNTLVWTEKSGVCFLYMAGMSDSWTEEASYIGSTSPVDWTMDLTEIDGTVQEFDLLATNHDICIATAYDIETQMPTVGTEVYCTATAGFPPEEEVKPPRYSIATSILDGTARQIMRLTDSTAKVKLEEFEAKLESVEKGGTPFLVPTASGVVPDYERGLAVTTLKLGDILSSSAT